jgi:SAM-dependent methyltransferase
VTTDELPPLATITAEVRAGAELLDLGCGPGRSLESAVRRFDANAVGLELNAAKVRTAQEQGLPVFQADILDLQPADFPSVRYVTMDNVLEHLPTLDAVETVLAKSCQLAADAVYVRHPSFEDEEYLAGLGLKQYWTDWPGAHTAHIRLHEFVAMANRAGVYRVLISPVLRAVDSADPTLLPLDAPPGQRKLDRSRHGAYDPDRHGEKPAVTFDRPVYFAFDLLFVRSDRMPRFDYPHDPEVSPARPSVRWPVDEATPARRNRSRRWVRWPPALTSAP